MITAVDVMKERLVVVGPFESGTAFVASSAADGRVVASSAADEGVVASSAADEGVA